MNKEKTTPLPVRLTLTLLLVVMAAWLLNYTWTLRRVHYRDFDNTDREARQLQNFPHARYEYGRQSWLRSDVQAAAAHFRAAVAHDPLFIDAWIELARAEQALGQGGQARRILGFVDGLTKNVRRWKWPQTLLANELGMETILVDNVNYLARHGQKQNDAFYLTDVYYKAHVKAVLAVLDDSSKPAYLNWLMRYRRTADAMTVWADLQQAHLYDDGLVSRYVHFLLHHDQITAAGRVWQGHTGTVGMTNGGFEADSTRQGFDWRYPENSGDRWWLGRVTSEHHTGLHAFKVRFEGRENLNFHHLYQVVAVLPDTAYRLSFNSRTRNLTTDQRPFVEVYGFKSKGLYRKSEMLPENRDWPLERIEFRTPPDCHAVVVRLRRLASGRFDCKLQGTVWLDDFRLAESSRLKATKGATTSIL